MVKISILERLQLLRRQVFLQDVEPKQTNEGKLYKMK